MPGGDCVNTRFLAKLSDCRGIDRFATFDVTLREYPGLGGSLSRNDKDAEFLI